MSKMVLYVMMVDAAPMMFMQEPCGRRVVRVELTKEQAALIEPRETGRDGTTPVYETVQVLTLQDDDKTR